MQSRELNRSLERTMYDVIDVINIRGNGEGVKCNQAPEMQSNLFVR